MPDRTDKIGHNPCQTPDGPNPRFVMKAFSFAAGILLAAGHLAWGAGLDEFLLQLGNAPGASSRAQS